MNDKNCIGGIHHITAIAGNPQKNIDFYTRVLGLKFLKRTVNFDDPYTYHFYYGDLTGTPGTILTFFPWNDYGFKGRRGTGQIAAISFSVPASSLGFWTEHLAKNKIDFAGPAERFNEQVLVFEDPDNFELEIAASTDEKRAGWNSSFVPAEHTIRGFRGASIWHNDTKKTESFMTELMGYKIINESNNRIRLSDAGSRSGTFIDLINMEENKGIMGVGAIHHIAFRTSDNETQVNAREKLVRNNVEVTPVIDRNYFRSVYFREPGNVLFEIATDPPGFLVDESRDNLGKSLKLPAWYESSRNEIEEALPKITIPGI